MADFFEKCFKKGKERKFSKTGVILSTCLVIHSFSHYRSISYTHSPCQTLCFMLRVSGIKIYFAPILREGELTTIPYHWCHEVFLPSNGSGKKKKAVLFNIIILKYDYILSNDLPND